MAQPQIALHVFAPEVQVTVTQPQILAGGLVVMKGRRLRPVEYRQFSGLKLDLSGGHVRVDRALGALAHAPPHREHVLAPKAFGLGEGIRIAGVENHLQ